MKGRSPVEKPEAAMHISNTSPIFKRAGILGLGLVGGSWARALKNLGLRVLALDVHNQNTHEALQAGAIDEAVTSINDFNGCDLLILCAPPSVVCETLPKLAGLDIGLITDVCSVKTPVMDAARGLKNFIGGHPMAGSEQTGFAASDARLFENAPYALCVASGCDLPQARVLAFEGLLEKIGARVLRMSAQEHDASVARVSHLPHAAAFALARVAKTHPECLKLAG
ncbi:MAG: prephenate dehydrogenase/arogenate dehydrogenase family protein, partial [Kiritimatiellaeota bacterium]|nr:prephenate dehydrogenase/arogenate dehydrogenase family protein [Kiritimatiellota bacterium]